MKNENLARMIVKFTGVNFIFYAMLDVPDVLLAISNYISPHSIADTSGSAYNLAWISYRFGLQLFAGALILAKTADVISLFAYGKCRSELSESEKKETEPNNAMERSRILVTDRAFARSAPSIRLAHLGR